MVTPNDFGAEAPKMFRIRESPDSVKAFRVSKDAVIAAAVFESDEVHIYRLFDAKGDFLGDKKPLAPVLKFKLAKPEVYGNVVDLQIHKKVESNGQVDYQM
jgi:hypothetical protein